MSTITEKNMEDLIAQNPDKYLGESGLSLVARQYCIGNFRFDLLFMDRHGGKLIVEIQRGTLDRNHMFKVFDYCDEYRERNPTEFVEPLLVANIIPHERKRRLSRRGIPFMEIPEEAFMKDEQPANIESQAKDIPITQPDAMGNQISLRGPSRHTNDVLSVSQLTPEKNYELNSAYHSFVRVVLDRKIHREVKAKELIMGSLGKMTHEQFEDFFDLVDDDPTGPWFGPTLNVPNRALIRACPIDQLNELVVNLVSTQSMKSLGEWRKKGFKGLSYGVASLILYIYEPTTYYVWLKKNHKGLQVLGRISFSYPSNAIAPESMDSLYSQFNASVISWRDELSIHERSVDWVLWAACELVNNPNNRYLRAYIDGSVE
ncbi:MAG: DUF91 domain-containing protein [Planctomycetes bacterium]|nr:DUF91 domain-containing protein [Planctomycetota bacterium]